MILFLLHISAMKDGQVFNISYKEHILALDDKDNTIKLMPNSQKPENKYIEFKVESGKDKKKYFVVNNRYLYGGSIESIIQTTSAVGTNNLWEMVGFKDKKNRYKFSNNRGCLEVESYHKSKPVQVVLKKCKYGKGSQFFLFKFLRGPPMKDEKAKSKKKDKEKTEKKDEDTKKASEMKDEEVKKDNEKLKAESTEKPAQSDNNQDYDDNRLVLDNPRVKELIASGKVRYVPQTDPEILKVCPIQGVLQRID